MIVACSACSHRFEGGGYRDEQCPKCGAMALATRACPHCNTPLGATRIEPHVFDECGRCGGVFIDQATIARVVADHSDELLAKLREVTDIPAVTTARKCPTCAVTMTKRMASGGSGVILDVCDPHGVFFDAGELQTLIKFAQREAERGAREGRLRYPAADSETRDYNVPTPLEAAGAGAFIALRVLGGPVGDIIASLLLVAIGAAVSEANTNSRFVGEGTTRPSRSLGSDLEAAQRRRRRDGT